MAELIAFIIERFSNFHDCLEQEESLGNLLQEAGFGHTDINNTLLLLEVLSLHNDMPSAHIDSSSIRVYCAEELTALPKEVCALFYHLEQAGAINFEQKELIIHLLLHLPLDEIHIDTAKIVVLLVMWSQNAELPVLIGHDLMSALEQESTMH